MFITTLAERSGVERSVIRDVLAGRKCLNTHPPTHPLARLERVAGRLLWEFLGAYQRHTPANRPETWLHNTS